ncbi:unnamed protein product [Linum tenue]|uniref:FLZ-type domain-containing protein n=1 Tax=Linum tenue TaxID=586396 RepID=A0AAV0KB30_9ROSI|nr:unnamed protein product [Linum tenue]
MYRGDQGFCSRQCRDKQVKLDEIKEAEESNLIFHLSNSYNSSRRRRQLKAAPLLQICSSDGNISAKTNTMSSSDIPRRRPVPVQYYYNRPLPLPPHQRLGYMNRRRQLAR